jgi:hypothetical protein
MSNKDDKFFKELRKLTDSIEQLIEKYDMSDRFICIASYGLIDENEDDEEDFVSVSSIYNFSIDNLNELDTVLEMTRKAYIRMTDDDPISTIFNAPFSN